MAIKGWVEKQYIKHLLKKVRKMKNKLLKDKKEEAIIKAKITIKEVLKSMEMEHNGVELTPELIDLLNEDETIEIFDNIIKELENMYVNKRKK